MCVVSCPWLKNFQTSWLLLSIVSDYDNVYKTKECKKKTSLKIFIYNISKSILSIFLIFKLRSLFVVACESEVLRAIWDLYLLEADPFLVFFLMLVMVINGRYDGQITTTKITRPLVLIIIISFVIINFIFVKSF